MRSGLFRRGNAALVERVQDAPRSPALLDEYGRKRGYFRWQVAALCDVAAEATRPPRRDGTPAAPR